ncbi:MAG: ABC transporter substrate-binding protein [Bacteroidota bacterium]
MRTGRILIILLLLAATLSITVFGASDKLVWCGWSGEEEATKPTIQSMVKSWNLKNPTTPVTWVGWPWANTMDQLIIRSQGGEALDVAQLDFGMFATLSAMDVLVDLNQVFGKTWLGRNFEEASLAIGRVNGKQLALPWTIASIGTVYNPTLLQKVGVKEPPVTIQEFESVLMKLKASDPNIIPYALCTKDSTAASDFQPWLWAFGGSYFDKKGNVAINNAQGVKTLTWYKSLLDRGLIKMDMSRFDARTLFAKGLVGFYHDAIMANGIAKTNGVPEKDLYKYIRPMQRPVLKAGDKPQSTMWGHLLVIFKKSGNIKMAGEFIKHIVGAEQSLRYFENSGMLPVMKSAMADPRVQNDDWSKQWLAITKNGRLTESTLYKEVGQINNIITEEIQAALLGKKTPQKALDDAATRIKSALGK